MCWAMARPCSTGVMPSPSAATTRTRSGGTREGRERGLTGTSTRRIAASWAATCTGSPLKRPCSRMTSGRSASGMRGTQKARPGSTVASSEAV